VFVWANTPTDANVSPNSRPATRWILNVAALGAQHISVFMRINSFPQQGLEADRSVSTRADLYSPLKPDSLKTTFFGLFKNRNT
jgi:hypothetical protein